MAEVSTTFREKWAILIGASKYDNIKPLKYCTDDVVAVGDSLRKYLQFSDDHILTFGTNLKLKPTLDDIYRELGSIRERREVQAEDLLLFYFCGHGFREKKEKEYLLPSGASMNALKQTGIELADLAELFTDTGCKNIVMFIDACREDIGARGALGVGEDCKEILGSSGIVTFFSCAPSELSYEIDDLKHGAFTHCFLEAIKSGECETAADLYEYLKSEVPITNARLGMPTQKPWALMEPDDKRYLPILADNLQAQRSGKRIDRLVSQLAELYASGELDIRYYEVAAAHLELYRGKLLQGESEKKFELIEYLARRKLKALAFRTAWDAVERRRPSIGEPRGKPKMEPLR